MIKLMGYAAITIAPALMFAPAASLAHSTDPMGLACKDGDTKQLKLCDILGGADEMIGAERTTHGPNQYYILARYDDAWEIYASKVVFASDGDNYVYETRTISRQIPAKTASGIKALLTDDAIAELDGTPYYPKGVICTDGSSLTVMMKLPSRTAEWGRHSCSGPTKLDAVHDALETIAFKADPQLASFTDVRK